MNTRQFVVIALLGALLSGLTACEGNLAYENFDHLSPNNYPKSTEDAKTLVTGAYNILNTGSYGGYEDWSWQSQFIMNEATTDEFVCYWGGSVWETYNQFLWNSGSPHVTAKTYTPYIKAITRCINTQALIDPIEMDEDLKARYDAELNGIISLLAYTLYDFYGPVPIVTDPKITLDPNTTFEPDRPTKEWMVNFIKERGRQAADNLPVTYPSSDYGRITKGAALMVLLKLAMHEKNWQEAADVSKEIMDLGIYQLQDSYISIFTVENEQNKEIILAIPEIVTSNNGNNWLAHILPSQYKEPNGYSIQQWGGYKVPWNMYDKFEKGDERLECLWDSLNTDNGMVYLRNINEKWAKMGAVPYKYPVDPNGNAALQGNDKIVFRYAGVLLLRAEALLQLHGLNQETINLVNKIRDRASTSLITLGQFSSKEQLNDFILDERFREQFMEGVRRDDLIRHGKFLEKARERGATADDHFLLFPIPQDAINANKKITQNSGY